jgi:hypothetical protein
MTGPNYWPTPDDSPTTRKEREDAFRNDTYFRREQIRAALDEPIAPAFTGDEVASQYPAGSGSAYLGIQPGQEMPYPVDVSFVEPCGEVHEIAKAAQVLAEREAPAPDINGGVVSGAEEVGAVSDAAPTYPSGSSGDCFSTSDEAVGGSDVFHSVVEPPTIHPTIHRRRIV